MNILLASLLALGAVPAQAARAINTVPPVLAAHAAPGAALTPITGASPDALAAAAPSALIGAAPTALADASALGSAADADPSSPAELARVFDNAWVPTAWVGKMLTRARNSTPGTRRLQDVVHTQGFRPTALNHAVIMAHNDHYTHEIPMGLITNQKQSGRCWIFAALNTLAAELAADGKVPANFEFSESYLHFFNMLEKANRHLENAAAAAYGKADKNLRQKLTPGMSDGGWFEWFGFLVTKYGLAPKNAMPETRSSEETATLLAEISASLSAASAEFLDDARRVKRGAVKNANTIKARAMTRMIKILVTHLGAPPESFDYRSEEMPTQSGRMRVIPAKIVRFTPIQFARDFVGFNSGDYAVIANFSGKKPGQAYEFKNSSIGVPEPGKPAQNVGFLNLAPERFEELTLRALRAGFPLWFAADVGKDVDYASGIMHPNIFERAEVYGFTPQEQIARLSRKMATYLSQIMPNHAMVLTGFDQPDPKNPVVKFKVENSWGTQIGSGGAFHLYREWFLQYVLEVIIPRRFLNRAEKTALLHPKTLKGDDLY